MRIAAGVEYDGSEFRGWQTQQPGVRTVQTCLQQALSRVADHEVQLVCAGRTDAGVHADAQVVHFDTTAIRSPRAWTLGANSYLPPDVNVLWARPVVDDFHARFSARARRYRYLILQRPTRSALYRQRAAWCFQSLSLEAMRTAALSLLGEQDFSAFRAAACQARSPMRCVYEIRLQERAGLIVLEIEANAFLHHMVRNIVGVLLEIGSGERPVFWAGEVLASRDRRQGGVTAPAQGLYLTAVRYPRPYGIPQSAGEIAALLEQR